MNCKVRVLASSGMNLYIDNLSALYFYSMVYTSLDEATGPSKRMTVTNAASSLTDIGRFDLSRFDFGRGPLHVLTGSASERSTARGAHFHVRSGKLPPGAFRTLAPDIFIASPELCFYEMAGRLPFTKLLEFGYLLCGTHTINPEAPSMNDRPALTTRRRLRTFAERMHDRRGSKTVAKALDLVLEGSASPRETKLALLLSMPVRLGGYGFEQPEMNHQIDFSRSEREMFGKDFVVLDLYWPKACHGVEYDGWEHHSEDADLSRDRRKSSELGYRDIGVTRVDKQQVASPYQVYVLARKLQHAMGIRHRKPTDEQWQRKLELFEALMR